MNQEKIMLSRFQCVMLLSASYLPLMVWYFPRIAVEESGMDAQWSVLGVLVVAVVIAALHAELNHLFPDMDGVDMLNAIWGRTLGAAWCVFYCAVYFMYTVTAMVVFTRLLQAAFWPNTPHFVLGVTLVFIAAYGAYVGVEAISRAASVMLPATTVLVILVCVLCIRQNAGFGLTTQIVHVHQVIQGIYRLLPLYLGFTGFLMVSPYYRRTSRWTDFAIPFISLTMTTFVVVGVFIACVLVLGWDMLAQIVYPTSYVFRLVQVQNFIIERVGMVFVMSSTIYTVLFVAAHLRLLGAATARLFHQKESQSKRYVFPYALAIVMTKLVFVRDTQLFWFAKYGLPPAAAIVLLISPALKILMVHLFHRDRVKAIRQAYRPSRGSRHSEASFSNVKLKVRRKSSKA